MQRDTHWSSLLRRLARTISGCLALLCLLTILFSPALSAFQDTWLFLPLIHKNWPPPPPPGRLLISEVMYNPSGEEPAGEWVEIANVGGKPVSLDGIKLGDTLTGGSGEGLHVFPNGIVIKPYKALVIANRASAFSARYGRAPDFELRESDPNVPNLTRYNIPGSYDMELNNSGDEVILFNEQDQPIDMLSWQSSDAGLKPPPKGVPEGHSLERYPSDLDTDSAEDWIDQPEPNPGQLTLNLPTPTPIPQEGASPTPGELPKVLISEVLYDPLSAEPQGEWIELYNIGGTEVDLSGCKLGDEERAGGSEGMLVFPDGSRLPAGGVLIIANNANAFFADFGFWPDYEMRETESSIPYLKKDPDWATGWVELNDTGDEVLLLDPYNRIIDAVSWGNSKTFLDPPAPRVSQGYSLERYPANSDHDMASDWRAQASPAPGQVELLPPTSTPTLTPTLPPITPIPTNMLTPTPITPVPPAGHLLISEVVYDPPLSYVKINTILGGFLMNLYAQYIDGAEWIEIYNPSTEPVDLSNYKIGDEQTPGGTEGMYRFREGVVIAGGDRIVVAQSAIGFSSHFGFFPDFETDGTSSKVPNLIRYETWSNGYLTLNNLGDEVLLLDPNDHIVDVVSYGISSYPGCIPHPIIPTGHSLERFPAGQDTDDCKADFIDQYPPTPGEPPE